MLPKKVQRSLSKALSTSGKGKENRGRTSSLGAHVVKKGKKTSPKNTHSLESLDQTPQLTVRSKARSTSQGPKNVENKGSGGGTPIGEGDPPIVEQKICLSKASQGVAPSGKGSGPSTSPEQPDNDREKALYEALERAVFSMDEGAVRQLLESNTPAKTMINQRDSSGETLLHEATFIGAIGIVRALLEHGADPNIQSKEGSTPLHKAVWIGNLDVVPPLLEYGANVSLRDAYRKNGEQGRTALDWAISENNQELITLLRCYEAEQAKKT